MRRESSETCTRVGEDEAPQAKDKKEPFSRAWMVGKIVE